MRAVSSVVLTLTWTLASSALADERIAGTIEDPSGHTVGGVRVCLLRAERGGDILVVSETSSGADGRFSLDAVVADANSGPGYLLAQDAHNRLGWSPWLTDKDLNAVHVRLREIGDYRGRIQNTEGEPIEAARITPRHLYSKSFRDYSDSCALPNEFRRRLESITDANGSFTLHDVPVGGGVSARVSATGHGTSEIAWNLDKPIMIVLGRTGSASGVVTCESDPMLVSSVTLSAYRLPDGPNIARGDYLVSSYSEGQSPAGDGRFEFLELPPGKYRIAAKFDESLPIYTDPVEVSVSSGKAVGGIVVPLRPAIEIRGRVVDEDGAGIKGTSVSVYRMENNAANEARRAQTDDTGAFACRVRPGSISVVVGSAPLPFVVPPRPHFFTTIEADQDSEWPPIVLQRGATLAVAVLDDDGQPVPNAECYASGPQFLDHVDWSRHPPKSNAQGRFDIAPLAASDRVTLWVRTPTAASDGPLAASPQELGPVEVHVSPKHAFHLKGRVIDEAGDPLPNASLTLQWHQRIEGSRGLIRVMQLNTLTPDTEGRFQTGALWPGTEYQILATAEGRQKSESAKIEAHAGQTHELAPLVLGAASGVVEGRVLDSSGQPIAGARVFNSGDGPELVETRTDSQGHFRLGGLFPGNVFVFAQREPYRFGGSAAITGKEPVTITLRTFDESRADAPRSSEPLDSSQRETARNFVEQVWAMTAKSSGSDESPVLIQAMARIDSARAFEWSASLDHKYDARIRELIAPGIAEKDAEEALALFDDLPAAQAQRVLLSLARRFVTTDCAKSMRFAEEALTRARSFEQPNRAAAMATIAGMLLHLDRADAARRLVEEATDALEKMTPSAVPGYALAEIAQTVAALDADRALRLIEPITEPHERARAIGGIARTIARRDPQRAVALVDRISDAYQRNPVKVALAYELAPNDAAATARVIDSMTETAYQSLAWGWAAVAVAPSDPHLAFSWIDRGVDVLVQDSDNPDHWMSNGGRPVFVARLAWQARRIGYPDAHSIVYRALSMRMPRSRSWSAADALEGQIAIARLVALTEPVSAAHALRALEPRVHVLQPGSGMGKVYWLQAWALADPQHGAELARKELERAEDQPEFDPWRSGVSPFIHALTIPHGECAREFFQESGLWWFPDEEM